MSKKEQSAVSVQEIHQRTKRPIRTIYDWTENYPDLVRIIKLGCIADRKKEKGNDQIK